MNPCELKHRPDAGPLEIQIFDQLRSRFNPCLLEVSNESHRHRAMEGAETHFVVLMVSEAWIGKSQVERHRSIYSLFAKEMNEGLHALSLQLFTPQEWEARLANHQPKPETPNCPHS